MTDAGYALYRFAWGDDELLAQVLTTTRVSESVLSALRDDGAMAKRLADFQVCIPIQGWCTSIEGTGSLIYSAAGWSPLLRGPSSSGSESEEGRYCFPIDSGVDVSSGSALPPYAVKNPAERLRLVHGLIKRLAKAHKNGGVHGAIHYWNLYVNHQDGGASSVSAPASSSSSSSPGVPTSGEEGADASGRERELRLGPPALGRTLSQCSDMKQELRGECMTFLAPETQKGERTTVGANASEDLFAVACLLPVVLADELAFTIRLEQSRRAAIEGVPAGRFEEHTMEQGVSESKEGLFAGDGDDLDDLAVRVKSHHSGGHELSDAMQFVQKWVEKGLSEEPSRRWGLDEHVPQQKMSLVSALDALREIAETRMAEA